ncbi:peptide-binding protein, PDZ/DHR/GLGF domain-containing, putative [Geotalea daltonii FRC-32]|uniref:Peptide-binding protein, PDZ/DHR/GLGF domain-containing, putative n=1 Tax=Geotalea daltonii (strain DSM 22248 / JCM 15807 / FRC-32) TaxID=316067 RepID=B9LZ94_GEODF|nr:PDZ domain-containing protein [Geotalea daltonii]ACM20647.1 peptide-binding protein, PDZ/DHR/GLGF domain-containing, putative [Geotalea daltonii FRC-32]
MLKTLTITLSMFTLTALQAMAANSASNFGGIGIDGVPWANGQIVVRQMVAGGPAHLAGLKTGDIITQIDGKPTEGSNFQDMVDHRLRGIAGTKVMLKVRRPGIAKAITFNLTRRQLVTAKTKGK